MPGTYSPKLKFQVVLELLKKDSNPVRGEMFIETGTSKDTQDVFLRASVSPWFY